MSSSLKAKTAGALSWSFVQEAAQRFMQVSIGILLARMLAPEAFGLIAMLTVFIAVAQALMESGFGAALIQRKEPTDVDQCSVFYFNILISFVLAGALCFAAPWIAQFYKQPELTSLTRVLSLVLVINGLSVVQNALLVRRLDFKRQTVISIASISISGAFGLALAWRGFGVWSLVMQQISGSVVRAGLYWALNRWRPRLVFSLKALREMFAFGSGMVASSLLNTIFDNLYTLVIGRLFSATTLGFYNRAYTLAGTTSQSLGTVANRVTFPVFSQLQEDPPRLRRALQKGLTTVAFVQFPLMIGLAAVAEPLVLFLLTEKWAPCIPFLQLLCFAGMLYPVHLLNLNVLLAMGRSDLFFRLEVIKKLLIVVNIAVTYRWGVLAMIVGMVLSSVVGYFVNSWYTKRFVGYSVPEQLRDLLPYLAASVLMGAVVMPVRVPLAPGHGTQLLFKIGVGVLLYWGVSRGLRLPALDEILSLVRARRAFSVRSRALPTSKTELGQPSI